MDCTGHKPRFQVELVNIAFAALFVVRAKRVVNLPDELDDGI